jgi:DNA repair protein RecO (recombination protein O)
VFNRLRVQVAPRRKPGTLARLEQAQLVDWHPGLRDRPARFALASYLVELLDRLAPEGAGGPESARLFRFAEQALRAVEAAVPDARLRALLELRALDALGLRPQLAQCLRCGAEPDAFHVAEGGALCARCAAATPGALEVRRGTLRALEQGLRLPLSHLGRLALSGAALAEAAELLARFQRFHVGVELRSEPFLTQQLAGNSSKSNGSSG